jgi:hypothetical protein
MGACWLGGANGSPPPLVVVRANAGDDDAELAARLWQEAGLFAGLAHRNVVQFLGACTVPPNYALVLEYVADGPLSRHLSVTLSPALIVNWAEQIATVRPLWRCTFFFCFFFCLCMVPGGLASLTVLWVCGRA